MADYGSSDTSTTSLGANQFPIADVYVPNTGLKALGGGPKQTDGNGKDYAPALMYVQDGSDVAQGTTTQTKATDGSATSWSVVQLLKGILDKLLNALAVTQSGTWTVQPGNTANTTAWKVDGSGVTQPVSGSVSVSNFPGTQPVSGTVTANAGTGTFTNQQSNITADYDTGAGTQNMTMYGVALPASGGSVAGGTATNPMRTDPTGTTTQPISGTITANAGTGNMGSNLAQVAGNNVAVGNNAVPVLNSAAPGIVAAWGSNPAALTSATDYSFKWGAGGTTQVNHILLQNNTASSLNWDLDATATGGSPTLASGQTLFLDVQTSTLHLFQAGTPNVNGTASGNIAVRGWL